MKNTAYIICILICLTFPGCNDTGTEKSDPQDIVGTWTVTKVEKDGIELSFDNGEFQFTATAFTGWVTHIQGMGDATVAGDYTADGKEMAVGITASDNEDFMETGDQIWSYKADPSRLKVWYGHSNGYHITIKLEK